jgi:acyl-coenzyme A thioesterase PaaI-like protein
MTTAEERDRTPSHILADLGFRTEVGADEVRGQAAVLPTMFVPGTVALRTSILATFVDMVSGLAAMEALDPAVPVTVELDVHLYREPRWIERVHVRGRALKAGGSVVFLGADIVDGDGAPLAVGNALFMTAPGRIEMPAERAGLARSVARRNAVLRIPLVERAGCTTPSPGVATIAVSGEGLNASSSLNGGLIALAVEEAVLSLAPPRATLSSMGLRYLRAVRTGPAVASAQLRDGLGQVEVRDAGHDDRLAVVATTRLTASS